MSDVVLYTPTEYLPVLVVMTLIITTILTVLKGRSAYNEYVKSGLRSGTLTEAPAYGMDYLAGHLGTIVIGVVGGFLAPGIVYEALGSVPDYAGCLAIAFVWAVIVGIKGAETMSDVVDLFRDKAKIKTLTADAKKKTE